MSDITGSGDNDGINLDNPNLNVLRRINPELLGRLNLSGILGQQLDDEDKEPPLDFSALGNTELGSREQRTEAVPDELQDIELKLDLDPYELDMISVDELRRTPATRLDPEIPNWVAPSLMPDKDRDLTKFGVNIRYGDRKLEPAVVLGTDQRRTYFDTRYPWGCICKVITSNGSSGTGVIVGPRHVLTASHVVNWGNNNGVNGTVEVHRAGPFVRTISPIRRVHAFTRINGPTIGWTELDEDYAVVVTRDRIGDRFGWLGTRQYHSSWDDEPYWYNLGYPGDIANANRPTWQRRKWLDEHAFDFGSGRAMDTNADINPGNSGGPMFAFWSNGPYVVSVVSAHDVADQENYCSGGSDLPRLVNRARQLSP